MVHLYPSVALAVAVCLDWLRHRYSMPGLTNRTKGKDWYREWCLVLLSVALLMRDALNPSIG